MRVKLQKILHFGGFSKVLEKIKIYNKKLHISTIKAIGTGHKCEDNSVLFGLIS